MNKLFLNKLLTLAEKSYNVKEIPVGAIVVKNNKIIGEGINSREKTNDIAGHAEINALNSAAKRVGDWRLDDCEMYVTLKPCLMCIGAIVDSRIKKVYYLCDRTNVCQNYCKLLDIEQIDNKKLLIKYQKLLKLFFENKRN